MSKMMTQYYTLRCYKKLSGAADQLRALLTTQALEEEAVDIFDQLRKLEAIMDHLEERYAPKGQEETRWRTSRS